MNFIKRLFSPNDTTNRYSVSICCIIRDENQYLEEWIKYHLLIGVEHFFIYDNESVTPIKGYIEALGLSEFTTVNKIVGKAKQVKAYSNCLKHYGSQSKWIAFIDTDEFIVPKNPGNNIVDFLKDYEPYGGLGVNWQVFGSNNHQTKPKGSQLESFVMRAKETFEINNHVKCIVQPKNVSSAANAHRFNFKTDKYCVNENFEKIEGEFSPVSVKKIQLNHYYCRSLEEYQDKIKRGLGDTRRKRSIQEFYNHDKEANEVHETIILDVISSKRT